MAEAYVRTYRTMPNILSSTYLSASTMDTDGRSTKEQTGGIASTTIDSHGTTDMRNLIDASSLSSWMSRQPGLSDLLLPSSSPFIDDDDDDDDERGGRGLESRLSIRQFGFGQSNPTYLLTIVNDEGRRDDHDDRRSTPTVKLVLRRRPDMIAHPTSHDLHREYRVLVGLTAYNAKLSSEKSSGIESSNSSTMDDDDFDGSVPVPRPYAYCSDESIIGSEFYLMEYVEGRIFVDPRMTAMECPEDRSLAYLDAVRVLSVRDGGMLHAQYFVVVS